MSESVIALLVLAALGVVAFMQRSPDTLPAAMLATGDTIYFRSCAAARAAGAAPLIAGGPGYRAGLDADGDGVACEPYLAR